MHVHFHLSRKSTGDDVCRLLLGVMQCEDKAVTRADLHQLEKRIMATLEQLLAKVEENTTVVGSLNTMLDELRTQITDILTGARIPPAVQAKVDAAFAALTSQGQALADTVLENTGVIPSDPPPPPAPPANG